jgi:hypothetical protein
MNCQGHRRRSAEEALADGGRALEPWVMGGGARSSVWDDASDGFGRKTAGKSQPAGGIHHGRAVPWRRQRRHPRLKRVAVDVSGEPYVDLEREAAALILRE